MAAMPMLELVDMPETNAGMVRQNARWYKGVLDDIAFLAGVWRARPTAYNFAQLTRHVGNKVIEWPIAAVVYPALGFLGWHLAYRFSYHPVWFLLGVAFPSISLGLTIWVGGIVTQDMIESLTPYLHHRVDVTRTTLKTLDPTRGHARLEFKNAKAERLGAAGQGWDLAEAVLDRAAVLLAFEQVGGSQACLEMATDYAKSRYAFSRPIGSFQAIKHKLADMYVAIEVARSNAYYGAWALSTEAAELPFAAAAARAAASDCYYLCAKENIQTHGGMGFTWEVDCHLFFRRAKLLALQAGAPAVWKEKLVKRLEQRNAA